MADHVVSLTDEETAAAKWSAVHNGEPSIEAWLYARLRGELAAAVQGYNGARDAAILSSVKATKNGAAVQDVVAAADAAILKPQSAEIPIADAIEEVP